MLITLMHGWLSALAFPGVTTGVDASLPKLTLEALRGCTISPLGYLGSWRKNPHQLAYAIVTSIDFLSGEAGIVT